MPLTPELIREYLNYNPDTGLLTWRKTTSNRNWVGREVGSPSGKGYIAVHFLGNRTYAHRLAWAHYHGELAYGDDIHHVNGDRTDNRIINLQRISRRDHLAIHGTLRCS